MQDRFKRASVFGSRVLFAPVRSGKEPVLDEAAAAESDLAIIRRDRDNVGTAEPTAGRPGIPLNRPAGNRKGVWIEERFIHRFPYRTDQQNLKP